MTRKKVQLSLIPCESARKSTFKKRKKGLLKKIEELSTLCGIEACAVISSPYDPDPVVWPTWERANRLVVEFRQLPDMDQHRKMFDHPAYLRTRVAKSSQQLSRLQRDNREREVALAMYGCLSGQRGLEGLTLMDLNDLGWVIERSFKEIGIRKRAIYNSNINNNIIINNSNVENDVVAVQPLGERVRLAAAAADEVEVDPGLGHMLGLGFGTTNAIAATEMQMQMQVGPMGWPVGQYYEAAPGGFDHGASGSGGDGGAGGSVAPGFGGFFRQ